MEVYFFVQYRERRWGSRWTEEEAVKNQRIVDALVESGTTDREVQRILEL